MAIRPASLAVSLVEIGSELDPATGELTLYGARVAPLALLSHLRTTRSLVRRSRPSVRLPFVPRGVWWRLPRAARQRALRAADELLRAVDDLHFTDAGSARDWAKTLMDQHRDVLARRAHVPFDDAWSLR